MSEICGQLMHIFGCCSNCDINVAPKPFEGPIVEQKSVHVCLPKSEMSKAMCTQPLIVQSDMHSEHRANDWSGNVR